MKISDEAMAAASRAMQTVTPPPGVAHSDWLKEHGPFALLAGAISAAAPYLMASAWDEGEQAGYENKAGEEWGHEKARNPYRLDAR